jgi:hypothetical protein
MLPMCCGAIWCAGSPLRRHRRSGGTITTSGDNLLAAPLSVLGLTIRTNNALLNNDFSTVGDVVARTEVELARLPLIGGVIMAEIKAKLSARGLALLPTAQDAMMQPMRAFPSWLLRIECDRCGQRVTHNEAHMSDRQRGLVLRVLLFRMRHDGCGGRAARAELLSGVEGEPVRKIVLVK